MNRFDGSYINITTPIYYTSGDPHIGHAYTTILASTLKNYLKLSGYDARMQTGTDEHGLKVERIARENGVSPETLASDLANRFMKAWEILGIDYDDFLRTTEKRHIDMATWFWKRMEKSGDIYYGTYEGLYCVDCEQYYSETDLIDGNICPVHNKTVERMHEKSYFFRLSKYQNWLEQYIEENEAFISPGNRRSEVLGFLRNEGLKDISISRTSFDWGIPVPGDEKHIMYVWIDALVNYVSSLGGVDSNMYDAYWKNTLHIMGKDILRFHAIYWPCMLKSAGLPLPKCIVAHGWWTVAERKISKSDRTTRIDPVEISKDISSDGLKFYLLKETSLSNDGSFDYSGLIDCLNTYLANKIGNLVYRSISMINKYLNGVVPAIDDSNNLFFEESNNVIEQAYTMRQNVDIHMECFDFSSAVNDVIRFVDTLNEYIDRTLPWKVAKEEDSQRICEIFAILSEGIRWVSGYLKAFTPVLADEICKQFNYSNAHLPEQFIFTEVRVTSCPQIIFKRIEDGEKENLILKWRGE